MHNLFNKSKLLSLFIFLFITSVLFAEQGILATKDKSKFTYKTNTNNKPWMGILIKRDRRGVRVTGVMKKAAAYKAGIISGDILTRIDNYAIRGTKQFVKMITKYEVGQVVKISIIRADKNFFAHVKLVARPAQINKNSFRIEKNDQAPDFNLVDLKNNNYALESGSVKLIQFWAVWCPSCRASHLKLEKIYQKYNKKFTILTIVNDELPNINAYIKDKKYSFPVLIDNQLTAAKYGVVSIPTFIVIDKDNKVKGIFVGTAGLDAALKAALDLI